MVCRPLPLGRRFRALVSTAALLALSAITVATVLVTHPRLSGAPASWRGDDLAITTVWLGAIVCAAWLTLSALACLVALTSGRHSAAHRIAGWAPPAARRVLQTALIGTWALLPTAASAAATPSAPVVVHVDRHGRIAWTPGTGLRRVAHSSEVPVVRAPPAPSTTSTTTSGHPPPTTPPRRARPYRSAPNAPAPHSPARPVPDRQRAVRSADKYVVRAGDNLWRIARAEVVRSTNIAHPDEQAIARYWQRVIAANRATLRSGNPSLIFPGEIVTLP